MLLLIPDVANGAVFLRNAYRECISSALENGPRQHPYASIPTNQAAIFGDKNAME
jgi:hypothetical protein